MAWTLLGLAALFFKIGLYCCQEEKLLLVTVATEETDGYKRFMRSAKLYNIDVEVFGLNQEWLGGDMANGPGGGHKLNLLRNGLKKYKDDKNLILMFTDSYDVVLTADKSDILQKFKKFDANILISSEDFIWPDRSLASKYPALEEDGYRYLCSGGIIGYAPALYEVISLKAVNHTDDDQLYYTHIFLDDREKYNIKLDRRAELFQNLNGARDHVEVSFDDGNVVITNTRFKTRPVVIHGNGPSKIFLNYLGNYVPKGFSLEQGCLSCHENKINLDDIKKENWPKVLIGVHIPTITPFLGPFLKQVSNLDYPKDRIDIFIHNGNGHDSHLVDEWVKEAEKQYNSVTYKGHTLGLNDQQGKNLAMLTWRKLRTDYYFSIDSSVTFSNMQTLQLLMEQNRTIITPMMSKYKKFWSNFWGDISADGFYARSPDYLDIVKNVRRGVWNSPFVSHVYLINLSVIDKIGVDPFTSVNLDTDIQFCANLRNSGLFMYATNLDNYGHLKEMDSYTTNYKHNDLYQLFDNKLDWEDKYLHEDYTKYLAKDSNIPEPCPDVFWVPIATETFTRELIEECEHFGEWSGGKNNHKDERIAGGYENVPTVDIHMNQIGFEKHWIQMLTDYFSPMVSRIYTGYFSSNKAFMNFVVKYSMQPGGQYFLRPHHDASTYTVNMALNTPGVDYEGGGARFLRYNCSVSDTKTGWALLHPGRLTHQHEGLPLKSGLRYIMVSFVDP